jgi:SAM-dependent MidA family methyltransferase
VRVDLPEPNEEEREHSELLCSLIRDEIRANGGAIRFDRYMELALYAPGLGYYSAGAAKFGASGDFVTAPELGFVFARCLARAIAPSLREKSSEILELGPGSGALAVELLLELERVDALPSHYRLLERSADLRERQRAALKERCPHLEKLAVWLDMPPTSAWRGALIANEIVDALPVRLFELNANEVFERRVGVDGDNRFVWRTTAADESFRRDVDRVLGDARPALPRPYRSEICSMLAPWFEEIARTLSSGGAWFIDYGHRRNEYYAAARSEGTVRCHYRHRGHDNPLILTGLQDITAWVDFDALTDAARSSGFHIDELTTQADFLIRNGLEEIFGAAYRASDDEIERYRLAQQVKRLTLPDEMGESFKVMAMHRG